MLNVIIFLIAASPDRTTERATDLGGLAAGAARFWLMRPRNGELFECIEQPGEEGDATAGSS